MTFLPPPPPFDLEIEDLTIGVPTSSGGLPILGKFFNKPAEDADGQPRAIVRDVSATCASGEMLAIIGGSGSGKTTVLNAIVGRLANLPIESGEISFMPSHRGINLSERKTLSARKMKDKIGFVKQQDTLLEHLTGKAEPTTRDSLRILAQRSLCVPRFLVRETLSYAAALRLPREISAQTRELIVTQTIEELGLRDVADTIVGGALRKGISGGERRRLSIGCALVAMPSVLVADESTTGLDSFTAYALLLTLSQLARRNRTVILTLHQPRSATFPLFDRILLLSKGRVVFSGPREKVLPWFQHVNEDFKPGDGVNPMDWLIDVSTVDTREGKEEESRERVGLLVRRWEEEGPAFVQPQEDDGERGSEEDEGDEGTLAVLSPPRRDRTSRTPLNASALEVASILSQANWDMQRIGILRQTAVLLSRATKDVSRNYGLMLAFTLQSIILGAILGFAFFRLPEDPSGIQSLKYCNTDLILFDREREDHLYAVFPWLVSEFCTNLPVLGISASLFALLIYFMVGMRSADHFAWAIGLFIAENVLVQLVIVGFALLSSSLNRVLDETEGPNTYPRFDSLLRPPVYINWMRFISPYYYGFRIVAISQFRDRTFACDGIEGLARNQCDGNQVLNGVLVSPTINPSYYLAALCGMVLVTYSLAGIILHVYHPGGVKHANQLFSSGSGKEAMVAADMEIVRQRIDVDVRHICLKWTRRGTEKTILHNINARFPAGEVTAIMGPSGAGKSSLLQLVAGRQMNAGPMARFQVEGAVLFNGRPRFRGFRALVAFVEQEDDHHLPALTVRETLRYAAILRLPKTMTRKRKIARAEEVLQMLGLTDCADNVVGGELLKGISGGEKRRLSLAVEMISDEPTSGLDALTAHNVMLALKAIAASGRTVIASIHQPRSDIWHAGIDNVVLLAKGGRTAFSCPKSEIGPLCASLGYPLPPMVNPADWILDLVSVDSRGDREKVTRKRVSLMIDNWAEREAKKVEDKAANRDSVQAPEGIVDYDGKAPVTVALPVILERMARNLWRQPPVFWMRLYQTPLLACIMLMIYQRLKYGPTGGQDRMGFVLEIISPLAFVGVLNNVAIFPADRDIFFHEVRTSGAYSASTFVLAFTIVELPLEIGGALLSAVVTNIGAGMQTNARIFFQFAFAQWALVSTGESIGMMFGSFTRSMGFNVSLVSTFITILVQLSGVVSVSLPKWLGILAWSTTLKYSTRIVMINEAVGLRLHCTDDEVMYGQCLVQTGEQLLELLGWKDWNVSKYCGILFAITVGYRILAWAVIRAKIASL
ncbi:hypothetical protein FRC00_006062 [Tulasnella sp. 408]|nr:hypothetical protein FRC00_006062 [Tulasnella sp. 408]